MPFSTIFHLARVSLIPYSTKSVLANLIGRSGLFSLQVPFDNWAFVSEDLCCGNTIISMQILFSPLIITLPLTDVPLPIKHPD